MSKFIVFCMFLCLVSCGGGGASSLPAPTLTKATISTSSYIQGRHMDFHSSSFPQQNGQALYGDAQVFFHDSGGSINLFLARLQYDPGKDTVGSAKASVFEFYRLDQDRWVSYSPRIDRRQPNCLHPRKAISTDFNLDGHVDFLVACHGFDGLDFPGEFSIILLSTGPDQYIQQAIGADAQFTHGVSAADLNQDGAPDLVFALGWRGLAVYINDGRGNFIQNKDYLIGTQGVVYSVELIDIDKDLRPDLVLGGHEWQTSTRIILATGSRGFDLNRAITITAVPGAGVVLDFVHALGNLYILRTGDPTQDTSNFYKGLYLQQFNPQDMSSRLMINWPDWKDTRYSFATTWLNWIRYYDGYIMSLWGQVLKIKIG